jgi:hypothetical protein
MELTAFLKSHYKTKKDTELISTHTRIPNEEYKIKGGNYHIINDIETFYELVYKKTIIENKPEYLTEAQCSTVGAVYIDLDFHYSTEIIDRQHNHEWTEDFIDLYLKTVAKYYIIKGIITANIMQRDGVNRLQDKTKDGIHILFSFSMDRKIQQVVRDDFLKNQTEIFKQLPLINTPSGVFDEGINKGTTNLTVFGCRKPLHEPYKLVRISNWELDPIDNEFMIKYGDITMTQELYNTLSVQMTFSPIFEPTELSVDILNPVEKYEKELIRKQYLDATWEEKNNVENLEKLFQCFTDKRLDEYDYWSKLAWATYNALGKEGKSVFLKESARIPSRNTDDEKYKAEEFYDNITVKENGGVSWGSLHMWAKEDNEKLYTELFPIIVKNSKTDVIQQLFKQASTTSNSVDIAKYFIELYGGNFKCVDIKNKTYYNFVDKLWVQDVGGSSIRLLLSNECVKPFNERMKEINLMFKMGELSNSTYKRLTDEKIPLSKCINMLSNSGTLDSILKDITDRILDKNFETSLNKALYTLPIKGGKKIDMRTLVVEERTIEDRFTYECDVDWIQELTKEQTDNCDKYFSDLFRGRNDTAQVVLDLIKSSLTGKPLRNIIFPYGSGRNGKSVLLNLLRACFTSSVRVISKDVILKKIGSSITTELEKLDKCRIGFTTELKEEDKMNEGNIKAISGGDEIDVRPLFKTNTEIKPTCTLWAITNELPAFKVEQAILDRLIIIPFKARFEVVSDFEDNIIKQRDMFFSYILQKGRIFSNFEDKLTDEMKGAAQEYADNHKDTSLEDFIESRYEKTDDLTNKIIRDEFIKEYGIWFRSTYPERKIPSRSTTKFTRDMSAIDISNKPSNGKTYFVGLKLRPYKPSSNDNAGDDLTDDENSY